MAVAPLLTEVLRSVSRAFYLSIQVLPAGCRAPIATGYLLARAADTIADTRSIAPGERLLTLREYGDCLHGRGDLNRLLQRTRDHQQLDPSEARLLERLPELVHLPDLLEAADRESVLRVVDTLVQGMVNDLINFPPEGSSELSCLPRAQELEQHLFLAAGCVGDFWTEILHRHVAGLGHWQPGRMHQISVEFGKALQLCNVLRDLPGDLRMGRCYLPQDELAAVGLDPVDLLEPDNQSRAGPVFDRWFEQAVVYFDSARVYVLSIPGNQLRLRLSVLWPCLIGLATLTRLAASRWLEPGRVKVPRSWVYRTLLLSLLVGRSDRLVDHWLRSWSKAARWAARAAGRTA